MRETKKILARRRRLRLTGWPTAMTVAQMRAWLNSQGVQVGKVKLVTGGIEIDPKTDRDTQLLMPLHGKHFEGMTTTIGVYRVETPTQLTAEEVSEQMMEWLKEKEQAAEYSRQSARTGTTPQRNWTPQRAWQVAVQSPGAASDEFWQAQPVDRQRQVSQVEGQSPRRNQRSISPKPRGGPAEKSSGGKGGGGSTATTQTETPKTAVQPPTPPRPNYNPRPAQPNHEWSTRAGNRPDVCWNCGEIGHRAFGCPRHQGWSQGTSMQVGRPMTQGSGQKGGGFGKGRGGKGVDGGRGDRQHMRGGLECFQEKGGKGAKGGVNSGY